MLITLLTDFGGTDAYAAVMKGVICRTAPQVSIIDITHEVPPQDTDYAAFLLHTAWSWFPENTVHTVVVDPGVGTERNILAVRAGDHFFLAPDNTVLKYIFHAFPDCRVHLVENRELFLPELSSVFHGRDIFAPAAAYLASGGDVKTLGSRTSTYTRGTVPEPAVTKACIKGCIVHIDHFGTCVTNVPSVLMHPSAGGRVKTAGPPAGAGTAGPARLEINGHIIDRFGTVYAEAVHGGGITLPGSSGYLEIAVRGGSAAEKYTVKRGDSLRIYTGE